MQPEKFTRKPAAGCGPPSGARPLNPLSVKLLEGEFKAGDKIKVTAKDEELIYNRK